MIRQPRLKKGKRIPLSSCLTPQQIDWVRRQMSRFDCGASWVVAVAISEVSGLPCVRPEELRKRKGRKRWASN